MKTLLPYLQGALAILITFGLAVFVHEFGHMMFALLRGVGVESFALGMGPRITSWKWRGIDFSLRWLPVGGFVKLQGAKPPESAAPEQVPTEEGQSETAESKSLTESSYDDMFALQGKSTLTKILVFGGGVFMNFVTACVAIALLVWIGVQDDRFPFVLEKVELGSTLATAGFQAGDQVVAFNGAPIKFYEDYDQKLSELLDAQAPSTWEKLAAKLGKAQAERKPEVRFSLEVRRGATDRTIALGPMDEDGAVQNAVAFFEALKLPPIVGSLLPNFPAENAGIKIGDRVMAVNGHPVDSYEQIREIINKSLDRPTSLTLARGDQALILTMTPKQGLLDSKKGQIGFGPGSEFKATVRQANPLKALAGAPGMAWARMKLYFILNVKFFKKASFKQVRENVTGPIGIMAYTAKIAQGGMIKAIDWFITLNLLLMMFNILPLPVLDGGFILLALIEGVIRRPVPPKVLGPIYTVFVVLFITLIAAISFQDLWTWIPKLVR